eukprot:CAMPEP_0178766688 /NCGR_PEP_ID=MMETSP0744-20121128/19206_1 /TAXON_ID=913974 /ORGANISM="Nitzschia punctata, Strain CCMP561" /LENGTH=49 /DNA_ID= /DNA_START= /DNA_END= /DNA_ORIENTATION=
MASAKACPFSSLRRNQAWMIILYVRPSARTPCSSIRSNMACARSSTHSM